MEDYNRRYVIFSNFNLIIPKLTLISNYVLWQTENQYRQTDYSVFVQYMYGIVYRPLRQLCG